MFSVVLRRKYINVIVQKCFFFSFTNKSELTFQFIFIFIFFCWDLSDLCIHCSFSLWLYHHAVTLQCHLVTFSNKLFCIKQLYLKISWQHWNQYSPVCDLRCGASHSCGRSAGRRCGGFAVLPWAVVHCADVWSRTVAVGSHSGYSFTESSQ